MKIFSSSSFIKKKNMIPQEKKQIKPTYIYIFFSLL